MSTSKVARDLSPLLKVYEDGRVERFMGTATVPPSLAGPILSKDAVFYPDLNLPSRLYLPKSIPEGHKLPLLVYFHGGAFCIESAFSRTYHNYLTKLAEQSNAVIVSVDYRRAPEHPLPAAYDDSWAALKWVASAGGGNEEWLTLYADFDRVFLAGDSAGANIAHFIARRLGEEELGGINLEGIVLVHPYFWGKDPIGDEGEKLEVKLMIDSLWVFAYPGVSLDDPVINPGLDPGLGRLGCGKVVVFVAERDALKSRGWDYYEKLKESGYGGSVEIVEAKEEEHVFHLVKPDSDNAVDMLKKIADFINQ